MSHDLERIEYRTGMLEDPQQAAGLTVKILCSAEISANARKAIDEERLVELAGVYGDRNASDPVEYHDLKLTFGDDTVEITVFNRGIALLTSDDDCVRRIHRVLCALPKT